MKLFNHVQIKVKDLDSSQKFYDAIMEVLGYPTVLEIDKKVIGYGTDVHDMFEICQADKKAVPSGPVHVAFNASSMEVVDDFYRTAIQQGAQCNGAPGFCPEYEEGYYAAFVIDLDGHNIEAVYKVK
ncbi:MAG: glyoxalase [Gimesia sp.]|nr:glyoxalase [Gimesia sp.]|tara:strand:- start:170 stop:550 length:381 start_codon:yes stop_codon:yes gene_type:complete